MKNRLISISLLVAGFFASPFTPVNAAEPPTPITFTTEKVVVFKDGHALVIKKGKGVTDASGEIHTLEVPDAAVLGTFWATAPTEGALIGMRAGWRENVTTKDSIEPALDKLAILRANVGSQCTIKLTSGDVFTGRVKKVLVQETTATAPTATQAPRWPNLYHNLPTPTTPRPSTTSGSHFVLETSDGDVLLPAADVQTMRMPEITTELARNVTTKTSTKRLSFRFEKPGEEHEITLMYFRPGVRWIPTYRLDLPKEHGDTAVMSLQAEVLNEAEDLVGAPFDIVVGVPHFRFKTTPSPLALESVMRDALAQAEPTLMGQMGNFSNASFRSRHGESYTAPRAATEETAPELTGETGGAGSDDLYVYSLPKLRLRKGDRAAVSIFKAEVPFRDVYTWDLHLTRSGIKNTPSETGVESPLLLSANKVWHQLDLTNTTGVPWTTGPVLIMRGQLPLAQELLTYTSPKGHCHVPVTVSVDTRGDASEKEIGRVAKALVWSGDSYMKIDHEAALSLHNHKTTEIDVEISARLGGRVASASHDGEVTLLPFDASDWKNYRGSQAVNNSSRVTWKVKVPAGEAFEPKIGYSFYTR